MNNSYRVQAERRASLSRAPVRGAVRPLLELPPWGYGSSGRVVLSSPLTTISAISRQLNRQRTRSVSPTKPSNGCCETGPTQPECSIHNKVNAGPSNWPNSTTHDRKAAEHSVVDDPKAVDPVAEKCASDGSNVNTAAAIAVPTQDPCTLEGLVDSMGDTVVAGGGPVTSSSMETWTTYDGTSTPPPVQSALSSACSVVTPALDGTWLRRISPTGLTTKAPPLNTNSDNKATDASNAVLTPPSPASDVGLTVSQKVITSTIEPTANEPLTPEVSQTPPSSSERSSKHKTVTPLASGEATANTPVSPQSNSNGKETLQHQLSSKTDLPKSPTTSDENKSNLMVGLVKVKTRHTGLMIDCPILETVCQNETESLPTTVQQSSSHKVVLIKAVVPRSAWNGHGNFSPQSQSSSPTSLSSAKNAKKDFKTNNRKSSVSVDTQTSDTLLLSIRRTISEHQTSPKSLINTLKYTPALEDNSRLTPSPKLSRCKSTERTSTAGSPHVGSHVSASPTSASQNHNRIPPETSNLPTDPRLFGNVQEQPKESGSKKRSSATMEYDALMVDTTETLKLDLQCLQFSSSGSNSDSDSVAQENTAVKSSTAERINRCSSSSSGEVRQHRRPSSSCQGMPTLNWSCAATAATASSDAIDSYKASSYVDEMAARTMHSPHQKPTDSVASALSPTSLGRPDRGNYRKSRANSKCPFSPNSSQTNETKARHMPDTSSRPNRSPCPWRPVIHDNVALDSWQEHGFICQDPHQYQHKHRRQTPSPQQRELSSTQYASMSESSLSNRCKSISPGRYHVLPTKVSMSSTSSKSQHSEQNSLVQPGYLVTSGGSDACATEPTAHHRHRATTNHRSTTSGDVESAHHRSRHNHHRSASALKQNRTAERKLPTQERYKTSTSAGKKSCERQRKRSTEAARRGDVAQCSYSTGSMTASRNARSATPTSKRQHSSSASRHVPAATRTCDTSVERRAMSRVQHRSVSDSQRVSRMHHSASQRPDRQSTTSGRHERYGSRVIHASLSRSADSLSRRRARSPSLHTNHCTSVAEHSKSTQSKRLYNRQSRRHDDRQSKATFYECRQPIVYCSPRSLKPFPPPISDRCPASSLDNLATAAVGTPSDAESVKFVCVQGHDESDLSQPRDEVSRRPGRPRYPRGPMQTSIDDQRRGMHAATYPHDSGARRHRKQLPVTSTVDSQAWCTEHARIAVPSVVERPAWKQ